MSEGVVGDNRYELQGRETESRHLDLRKVEFQYEISYTSLDRYEDSMRDLPGRNQQADLFSRKGSAARSQDQGQGDPGRFRQSRLTADRRPGRRRSFDQQGGLHRSSNGSQHG